MATFTTTQAAQIRMYLGYPDINRYRDVRLEGILTGDVMSDDAVALIVVILAQLAANDAIMYGTAGVAGDVGASAGIKKADEVEFFAGQSIDDLGKVREQLAARLSNMLGVPFFGDAFGEAGYPGDQYTIGVLGPPNGSGSLIPLG